MSQRGYFFDSVAGDRSYSSSYWANMLQFLRDEGVIAGHQSELAVSESSPQAMSVRVGIGAAVVQGRPFEVYSAVETVTITAADVTNPRIDRITLKLSYTNRTLTVVAKAGTPAASPSAPALTRDANTYECSLAQVYVGAGVTVITNANITDERGNDTVCGYSSTYELVEHATAASLDHPALSVGTSHLAAGAVTTAKIAGGAVGTTELANDAVTAAKIATGAVGNTELAADAVTADKIAADAVGSSEIAAGAVGSSELAAGAVIAGKIAANAVTAAEIAAGAVGTSELANDAVDASKIAADAVGTSEIAANAVTSAELAASAVIAGKIAANAVTNATIANDAVTAAKIAAGEVGETEIASPITVHGLIVDRTDYNGAGGVLTDEQDWITCATTGSNRTFTLPPAVEGKVYTFTKRDSAGGELRIAPNGSDTIVYQTNTGLSLLKLPFVGSSVTIVGATTVWYVIAQVGNLEFS